MTVSLIRVLAATAIASCLIAAPAAAQTAAPSPGAKPLKLNSVQRKPVATSATRTVKKKDGEYPKVAIKRRAKKAAAPLSAVPESLSPAAAQAFAAYELARVRVVTSEEADGARNLAHAAINAPTIVGIDQVQVVSAHDVNDIDRKAFSQTAVSLDALSRDLAGSRDNYLSVAPKAEAESWLQRLLMLFGGAFTAVAALVRTLLG